MGPYSHSQWPSWAYAGVSTSFPNYAQYSTYPAYLADSLDTYQSHNGRVAQHQQMSRTTESKPRLSKEEVEILEAEFQKNHKPSSSTKKTLAESMRVDNARINVGKQNSHLPATPPQLTLLLPPPTVSYRADKLSAELVSKQTCS